MTEPSAKLILVSKEADPKAYRSPLYTFELTMHRFVLAEFNTHRAFSRNSASSRARPLSKTLGEVTEDPAFPVLWTSEQAGMQGGDELQGEDLLLARDLFNDLHGYATERIAKYLKHTENRESRLHKSLLNRPLEPFMWHRVIVTTTEPGLSNFFEQRLSPLAQPEIMAVATAMWDAYKSTPLSATYRIKPGEWHLPYLSQDERDYLSPWAARRVSAARCARVSYLTHDGKRDIEADLNLYAKLVSAEPPHWSPLEHVAQMLPRKGLFRKRLPQVAGNFGDGWQQLRHAGTHAIHGRDA